MRIRDGPAFAFYWAKAPRFQGVSWSARNCAYKTASCVRWSKVQALPALGRGSIPRTQPMQAKVACILWFSLSWSVKHEQRY